MVNYDHGEEGDCVRGDVRDNHDDTWGLRRIMMMVEILMIRKGKNWQKRAATEKSKKRHCLKKKKSLL